MRYPFEADASQPEMIMKHALLLLTALSLPVAAQEVPQAPTAAEAVGTTATVADPKPVGLSPFDDTWKGKWLGRSNGPLNVVIEDKDGKRGGSLQALGTRSFGEDFVPIEDIVVKGNTIAFRATGGGGPFDVNLTLSAGTKKLTGTGTYKGYRYDVDLDRQ